MVLAPHAGLPPSFLLSLALHLVVIFGFLLSPAGDSEREAANRAVTLLLAPTAEAPEIARLEAAAHQRGAFYQKLPEASLDQSTSPTTIEPFTRSVTQSSLTMSIAISTTPPHAPVAAEAALDADYLLQWQDDIKRFDNAYYRGIALLHGDGSVPQINLLQSSGSAALDRAAVDTVEKLAPFAPFPESLARDTEQLAIIRTWQFRR